MASKSGAESGAVGAQTAYSGGSPVRPTDRDLATVVDAWPTLPAAVKAGILTAIRAAG